MNISFNWLSEFLKLDLKIDEVSNILTDIGLEVEGIKDYQEIKGNFEGLIVGEVIECSKHPNADRLKLTKVDVGSEILQIVCGAPNADVNQKVVIATVGTTLYPLNGEKFKINKTLLSIEEHKDFKKLLKNKPNTIFAIINGSISDKYGRSLLSYGDIIRTNDLKTLSKVFNIKKKLGVLKINKI